MAATKIDAWMWSEACETLARAERLHGQFFRLQRARRAPTWEPPADVIETADHVIVVVALPGVDPDRADVALDHGELVVAGRRTLPGELHDAVIHRLELPHGNFERRLALPPGVYDRIERSAAHGCLLIRLSKAR